VGLYEVSLLILFFLVLFFYRPYFDDKLFSYLGYLKNCIENNKRNKGAAEEAEN